MTPAAVSGGVVFASLAAGASHTCGLTSEGVVYCWGGNDSGQLGIGTSGTGLQDRSADKNVPTAVTGGISFRSLVAGGYHTCGLTSSWTTACWGLNASGQLLPHTSGDRSSPMEEVGLRFTRLVAGSSHTCGLEIGGAYCWGAHPAGSMPQLVGGAYSFANITSGASHACGLTASGTAYCWGNNASGQLGDGTTVGVTSPVAVSGGGLISTGGGFISTGEQLFFSTLSGGGSFTCGITTGGGHAIDVTVRTVTYCWGSNRYGQLGVGSLGDGTATADRLTPVINRNLFRSLATGGDHACGLNTTGVAYCWGRNDKGQLGDGTTTNRSTPTTVNVSAIPVVVPTPTLEKAAFTSLAGGGYHTCGLTSAGAAYCWGANSSGELGDGTTTNRASPVAVTGGKTFASIVTGTSHTCGLTSAGAAYCWGHNAYGQIGDGTAGGGDAQGNGSHTADRLSPVAVSGGKTFTSLAAGGLNTCGLTSAGVAYCWGNNYFGQIGNGTTGTAIGDDSANRLAPTAVSGNFIFSGLALGVFHTCGRTTVGKAYCWGQNSGGQIGDGTTGTNRLSPVAVSGNQSFSSLVVGYKDTCGVTASGGAFCWGMNNFGQIGDGTGGLGYSDHSSDRSEPVGVSGSQTFARLAAGESYACGVTAGSAAYCWGGNAFGQIGDGSMTGRVTPAAVAGSKPFTSLTTGWYHACGLTTAGIAYCWGANGVGQIGDGAVATSEYDHAVDRLVPTAVDVSAVVVPTLSDEIATPLQTGWNLVALQVTPASPVTAMALCASLDGTVAGSAYEIDRWENSGWDSHRCGLAPNNFTLEPGRGYFIRVSKPVTWSLGGTRIITPPSLSLGTGWNLVGVGAVAPGTVTAPSGCTAMDGTAGTGTVVELDRWEAGAWEGHRCGLPVNAFPLQAGRGYFVRLTRPAIWAPAGGESLTGALGSAREVPVIVATVSDTVAPAVELSLAITQSVPENEAAALALVYAPTLPRPVKVGDVVMVKAILTEGTGLANALLLTGGNGFTPLVLYTPATSVGTTYWRYNAIRAGQNGTVSVVPSASDTSGNVATTSATMTFTVDTTSPTPPNGLVFIPSGGVIWTNNALNKTNTNFTVTATVGADLGTIGGTAELLVGGASFASPVTAVMSGSAKTVSLSPGFATIEAVQAAFTAGTYSLTIRLTDSAGNTATSSPLTMTVNYGQVMVSADAPFPFAIYEGNSITYIVSDTEFSTGTSLNWEMRSTSGTASPSDFTDETLKGTCSFSGSGTTVITRTWANDRATEGSETWVMEVSYENGKVESGAATIYDSSVAPTATIARTSATINEGESVTYTIKLAGVLNVYSTVYWSMRNTSQEMNQTADEEDFTDRALSGSFAVPSTFSSQEITRTWANDFTTEGSETWVMDVSIGNEVFTSPATLVADTSRAPVITVTRNNATTNEGAPVTYTVTVSGTTGSTLYWVMQNTSGASESSSDFTDNTLWGSFTVSAGLVDTVIRTWANDLTTEGPETWVMDIRTGSIAGPVIVSSPPTVVADSSPAPIVTVTRNNATINEGASATFSIIVSGTTGATGSTLYWVMRETSGGTRATPSDFTDNTLWGSFTVSAGLVDTVIRTWANDLTTEGPETWVMDIRTGSIAGPVIVSSPPTVVADSSPAPIVTVTRNNATINKGASATFSIFVSGTTGAAGSTLYWVMRETSGGTRATPSDFTDNTLSGSYTVSAGLVDTVTRTWANDFATEGAESWVMDIRTGSTTGPVIGTSPPTVVADSSPAPIVTVVSDTATVTEGGSVTYTVTISGTTGAAGTTLYWVMRATSGASESASDFADNTLGGSFTVSAGLVDTVTRTWANDFTTEGPETWVMDIRKGSATGPVIVSSASTDVADTSHAPVVTVTPNATTIDEGGSVTYSIAVKGTTAAGGSKLSWAMRETLGGAQSASDFTDGAASGTFTVSAEHSYTVTRTWSRDLATVGREHWVMDVSIGDTTVTSPEIVVIYTRTVPIVEVTQNVASISEGDSVSYTIAVSGPATVAGSTLYWVMRETTNDPGASSLDFTDNRLSGSYIVSAGLVDTVTRTWANDFIKEEPETWVMEIRTGSVAGPLVGTSFETVVTEAKEGTIGDANVANPATLVASISQEPVASITWNTNSINEGDAVAYTVALSGTIGDAGSTLYWVMRETSGGSPSAADFTDNALSGSYTVSAQAHTITRTWSRDLATEGVESWVMEVRTGSVTGTLIGTSAATLVADTSRATITRNNATINEGESVTYTIALSETAGVAGRTLYWMMRETSGGSRATSSDFTGNTLSGSFTVSAGLIGEVIRTWANDLTSEGSETWVMDIRTGSIAGPVVGTSPPTVVADSSPAPVASITRSSATINETRSVSYTIAVSGTTGAAGSTLYWVMRETSGGTEDASDFADNTLSGSYTVSAGLVDTVTRTWTNDLVIEGSETWVMDIRTGSIAGPVVGTSPRTVVADSSPEPVVTVTPDRSNINEGGSVKFTIAVSGATGAAGSTLYWVMRETSGGASATPSDFTDNALSGSYTVSAGLVDTVTRTWANDLTAEVNETWVMDILTGSISGPVIASSPPTVVADSSPAPVATITMSTPSINEGASVAFTITVSGTTGAAGSTLYWVMRETSGASGSASDFTDNAATGTVTVSAELVNAVTRTWANDFATEGAESWVMDIRTGSATGPVIGTSAVVTVTDTSLSPSATISPSGETVNEGAIRTYTITTRNVSQGTPVYWMFRATQGTLNPGSFDTGDQGDFMGRQYSGYYICPANGVQTVTVGWRNDLVTEGTEVYVVDVKLGSTNGTVIGTGGTTTVLDTSHP